MLQHSQIGRGINQNCLMKEYMVTSIIYICGIFSESGPDPAEILTVVNVAENKYAFKTGYGRYMSVNTAGELTGRAEAIGPRETWEPVFEEVCVCALGREGGKEKEKVR